MLMVFLIFIVIALVVSIIYLSNKTGGRRKTRTELIEAIEKYVKGKCELIEGCENSYRISFDYYGKNFIYEDMEMKGFHDKVLKSYLKVQMPGKLTIQFTEKMHKRVVDNKVITATEMLSDVSNVAKVRIPPELNVFDVMTNDIQKSNILLNDRKTKRVFNEFKNFDTQGRPMNSLKIIDGMIILEFHSSGVGRPRSLDFEGNVGVLEDYMRKLRVIVNKVEAMEN